MKRDELREKRILGAMLMSGYNLQEGIQLTEDCFTTPVRKEIFNAIKELADGGNDVDIVSVNTYCNTHALEVVPTIDNLIELTESYTSGSSLEDVSVLKEISTQNRIENLCLRMTQKLAEPITTSAEIIAELQDEIDTITSHKKERLVTLEESITKVNNIIRDNRTGVVQRGTRTGFTKLDCNGGFHPSDLIIIGGQTSHGKTSFSMSIAMNMILADKPIVFYSKEMQHDQLTARLLSMQSGVSSSKIQYLKLSDDEKDSVEWAESLFSGKCLYYDDKSTSSLNEIIASIRQLHMNHHIEGAFIDYLQIIELGDKVSREQSVADAARKLKNLAKDLGIWIVALSQLSRSNDRKGLDRLRDSGQIGEAADTVLIVERPELLDVRTLPYPFSGDSAGKAIIEIAKGRNIGIGSFLCDFDAPRTMFTEVLTPLQEQIKQQKEDQKYGYDPFESNTSLFEL